MKWEADARLLYKEVVKNIPLPVKLIAAPSISRAAEKEAYIEGRETVSKEGLVEGIFEVVPQSYRARVVANLTALGINCSSYLNSGSTSNPVQKDLKGLWDNLLKIAEEIRVPVNEARTRSVLETFGFFFRNSPVSFRIERHPHAAPSLSVRYLETMKAHTPDPLTSAVLRGYMAEDTSPLFALFEEMKLKFDILGYGVNLDVSRGISKIAATLTPVSIDSVLQLDNLPKSVKKNVAHMKKGGFARIAMFEYDFINRSFQMFVMIREPSAASATQYRKFLSMFAIENLSAETMKHIVRSNVIGFAFSWAHDEAVQVSFTELHPHKKAAAARLEGLLKTGIDDAAFLPDGNCFIFETTVSGLANNSDSLNSFAIESDVDGALTREISKAAQAGV